MQLSSVALDLAAVRWTVVACIAAVLALSLARRHAERFARERATRVLRATDPKRRLHHPPGP